MNQVIKIIMLFFIFNTLNIYGYRVSILTSIYKGDEHIKGFLHDITQQTIFNQCELLLINANSPGNEEPIIKQYMQSYPNIVYVKLDKDPGLFGVWNLGIKLARADYVTNANIDDRLKFESLEVHADYLDKHPEIDLVYSGCYITTHPNETFNRNSSNNKIVWHSQQEFDRVKQLFGLNPKKPRPIPYVNNHPMWRKKLHYYYGLFDERLRATGGLEFWIRCTICGNAQFKMLKGIYGLYYDNPDGLSTKPDSFDAKEKAEIIAFYCEAYEKKYSHVKFLES